MIKILYITYAYNFTKTCSSRFFYDFLCENFDVDVLSPENEEIPYDEINMKKYDGIISFYYYPDFSKIKCNNKIFVPMYDGFSFSFHKVKELQNVKIINFCKKLHDQAKLFGLDSFYIKYYPELNNFNEQKDILFYWQRREISFSSLSKCFSESIDELGIKETILHSTGDGGGNGFVKPTEDEIKKFNIRITSWFEDKNDLINILEKSKYYIAPRKQEGIGLSFLDAMSYGAVIIANNDCTMNEYIKDGYNGYLIDFDNPKTIKFNTYENIQKNSINSFKNGREKYISDLSQLKEFIKYSSVKNKQRRIIIFIYFIFKKINNLKK